MAEHVHIPPDWAARAALWTAWPSDAGLWEDNLAPARAEVAALVRALQAGGERVMVLAAHEEAAASAQAGLGGAGEVLIEPFGDIWLRDTGPIFARAGDEAVALSFRFNGWGGKYVLDHDDRVAAAIARRAGARLIAHDFVLEGGAIELDGEGALLTTRQCLLNPNRNPGWTEAAAESVLRAALGVETILWLDEGLANDHTDGHVDNLARFIAPGIVVCQTPVADDPNADVLEEIALTLAAMRDAHGRQLDVRRIPSPGRVLSMEGEVMAASHMNFVIGARVIALPIYNERGAAAAEALGALFPNHGIAALTSNAILTGGGSFHCITREQPA